MALKPEAWRGFALSLCCFGAPPWRTYLGWWNCSMLLLFFAYPGIPDTWRDEISLPPPGCSYSISMLKMCSTCPATTSAGGHSHIKSTADVPCSLLRGFMRHKGHAHKWKSGYDRRSVGKFDLVSGTNLGPMNIFLLESDSCECVDMRLHLWWEDVSVVYCCCWSSPAQSFSDPSPAIHKVKHLSVNLLKFKDTLLNAKYFQFLV
jgi:hypothetical protein